MMGPRQFTQPQGASMPWLPKKTVVLPLDFSESSADALAVGRELWQKPADLHVVHVLLPIDYLSPVVMVERVDDESRLQSARKFCEEFLNKQNAPGVTTSILVGDPGMMI